MKSFNLKNGEYFAENVPLAKIADDYATPTYVYSKQALTNAFERFSSGFLGTNHLVCFAVKSNPSLAILNTFAKLGAGFDIVSGGELARVIAAGGDPAKVVFSGVGKTEAEMRFALQAGIFCFNVESTSLSATTDMRTSSHLVPFAGTQRTKVTHLVVLILRYS